MPSKGAAGHSTCIIEQRTPTTEKRCDEDPQDSEGNVMTVESQIADLVASLPDQLKKEAATDVMANLPDQLKKETATDALASLPDRMKKEAVSDIQAANPSLFPQGEGKRTMLWMTLFIGLFVVALTAIVCYVILTLKAAQSDTTALIAIVSAVVAGLIGLFANPPRGRRITLGIARSGRHVPSTSSCDPTLPRDRHRRAWHGSWHEMRSTCDAWPGSLGDRVGKVASRGRMRWNSALS